MRSYNTRRRPRIEGRDYARRLSRSRGATVAGLCWCEIVAPRGAPREEERCALIALEHATYLRRRKEKSKDTSPLFASLLAIPHCPFATPGSPSPGATDGALRARPVIPTGKTAFAQAPSNINALAVYQAQIAETMNV